MQIVISLENKTARIRPRFTRPVRQIVLMLAVLALVCAGAWLILPAMRGVFLANPWLNGFILFVFVLGLLACFGQVMQVMVSARWLGDFVAQNPGFDSRSAPRLLAPLAALLRERGARTQISASSRGSILDSVATRIDEARDITRYLSNLLIFLGLLGTFYGLATTIPGVVETIRHLAPREGEAAVEVFEKLMTGLESQLGGLGTAFSSSLLGLAGSLVVGLLELFAGHGQNRFYRELEEWLSSITRIGLAAAGEGEGGDDQGALVQVLELIATQLEAQEARAREDRTDLMAGIETLVATLQDRPAPATAEPGTAALLTRIAGGQERLIATQEQVLMAMGGDSALGGDAEARMRLRSIDVQLLRILEEIAAGRQETVADLRTDLGALTQAVRQLSRGGGH